MSKDIQEYLNVIRRQYRDELYFQNFRKRYIEWLENSKVDGDENLLTSLLFNLEFYPKVVIKKKLKEKISELKKLSNNFYSTVILPLTPTDGRHSGSNDMIQIIKEIEREEVMKGSNFLPYRDTILTDIKYSEEYKNLIFVDDISGTGDTVKEFIGEHHELMKGKKVTFLFIVVTKKSLDSFENIIKEYGDIQFEFIYCDLAKDLSAANVLSKEQYERLYHIEEGLWGKGNRNILGYKNSELLILFSHNIPNNTVSAFWYHSKHKPDKWKRLFVRISAPNRKRQNYENRKVTNR